MSLREKDYLRFWLELSRSVDSEPIFARLLELFRTMREVKQEPMAIMEFQREICKDIITLEFLKSNFKGKDKITHEFTKHMHTTVKHILDSLVWRVLNYDRVAIQIMGDHHSTGHADETFFDDLTRAEQIIREENVIVLLNDLTHILRFGDLTAFKDGKFLCIENKSGQTSSHDRRAIRQRIALEDLHKFLSLGVRETKHSKEYIFTPQLAIKTYHSAVAQAISQAKETGYHQTYLSDCLAIEVLSTTSQNPHIPQQRPFDKEEYVVDLDSLQIADIPVTKIAPYGIFPFDNETCFALIIGNLVIKATLNLTELQKKYRQFGLTLEIPIPTKDEMRNYATSPIGERKKLLHLYRLQISNSQNSGISLDFSYLWPLLFEFWREEAIIESQRQLLMFIDEVNLSDDKPARLYVSYKNERSIWERRLS